MGYLERSLSRLLLVLVSGALAGCSSPPCQPDSVLVALSLPGIAAAADTLEVTVTVDGVAETHSASRQAGSSEQLALTFGSRYPAGRPLDLEVRALLAGEELARADDHFSAARECTLRSLTLGSSSDAAAPDLTGLDLAGLDLSSPAGDLAGRDLSAPPDLGPDPCSGCGSAGCGSGVAAKLDVEPPADQWRFNPAPSADAGSGGRAYYDPTGQLAVITENAPDQVGSFFYRRPLRADTFDARFDFRITPTGSVYGDGLAFVMIRNDATVPNIDTAIGGHGAGLGMVNAMASGSSTLLSGYAVELDTYGDTGCVSVTGDHVDIDTLAECGSSAEPTPVTSSPATITLADGSWHTLEVHVEAGAMTVSLLSGSDNRVTLFPNIALPGFQAGQLYYFGITGATGANTERAEVRDVRISFPTPRCL